MRASQGRIPKVMCSPACGTWTLLATSLTVMSFPTQCCAKSLVGGSGKGSGFFPFACLHRKVFYPGCQQQICPHDLVFSRESAVFPLISHHRHQGGVCLRWPISTTWRVCRKGCPQVCDAPQDFVDLPTIRQWLELSSSDVSCVSKSCLEEPLLLSLLLSSPML